MGSDKIHSRVDQDACFEGGGLHLSEQQLRNKPAWNQGTSDFDTSFGLTDNSESDGVNHAARPMRKAKVTTLPRYHRDTESSSSLSNQCLKNGPRSSHTACIIDVSTFCGAKWHRGGRLLYVPSELKVQEQLVSIRIHYGALLQQSY